MAEIEYGAKKSYDYNKTISVYKQFLEVFSYKAFDDKAATIYGELRSKLEQKGELIEPNDLIIASIVLNDDGVLVTHNTKEFSIIENLKIEDWTQ